MKTFTFTLLFLLGCACFLLLGYNVGLNKDRTPVDPSNYHFEQVSDSFFRCNLHTGDCEICVPAWDEKTDNTYWTWEAVK